MLIQEFRCVLCYFYEAMLFFFKQKTAYEMRISDWSSDVCSSDLIVIVGANLTGGAAATTLRSEGFDGPIVMVGEEPHPPYERPPLSKEYLRDRKSVV